MVSLYRLPLRVSLSHSIAQAWIFVLLTYLNLWLFSLSLRLLMFHFQSFYVDYIFRAWDHPDQCAQLPHLTVFCLGFFYSLSLFLESGLWVNNSNAITSLQNSTWCWLVHFMFLNKAKCKNSSSMLILIKGFILINILHSCWMKKNNTFLLVS